LFGMQALHVSALFCSSCIMETELGSACGPLKTVPRSGGEPTTARWCERCSFVRTESSSNGATVSWSMDPSLLNGDNRVGLCWEGGKETRWRLLHHPPRSSGEGRGAVSIWVGFDMTCLAANAHKDDGLYSLYGLPSQKKKSLYGLLSGLVCEHQEGRRAHGGQVQAIPTKQKADWLCLARPAGPIHNSSAGLGVASVLLRRGSAPASYLLRLGLRGTVQYGSVSEPAG
jgi:hypothetical protein